MALGYCRECGGKASTEAPTCVHCGAVNPTGHRAAPVPFGGAAPAYAPGYAPVHRPTPSDGLAAVLSLVIPGAGQMYKGHVGSGLAWLLFTAIGYVMLVVPGLLMHLVCIVNAAKKEPAP